MPTARKTILIVDDDETIHRALQRTLRREPYDVLNAYDATEGLAILDRRPEVAAVLSDHYMPGVPGLELLQRVRAEHPEVVTFLLTGQADLQLVIRALNEGRIHRFFTKPWNPTEVRSALRDLLYGAEEAANLAARGDARDADVARDGYALERDERTGAFVVDPPEGDPAS